MSTANVAYMLEQASDPSTSPHLLWRLWIMAGLRNELRRAITLNPNISCVLASEILCWPEYGPLLLENPVLPWWLMTNMQGWTSGDVYSLKVLTNMIDSPYANAVAEMYEGMRKGPLRIWEQDAPQRFADRRAGLPVYHAGYLVGGQRSDHIYARWFALGIQTWGVSFLLFKDYTYQLAHRSPLSSLDLAEDLCKQVGSGDIGALFHLHAWAVKHGEELPR